MPIIVIETVPLIKFSEDLRVSKKGTVTKGFQLHVSQPRFDKESKGGKKVYREVPDDPFWVNDLDKRYRPANETEIQEYIKFHPESKYAPKSEKKEKAGSGK